MRNIGESSRKLRDGIWWKNGGTQLTGKTVGVVGFGHVGSRVGELLAGFRCKVLAVDIVDLPAQPAMFRQVSLDEALGSSDVLSLHVPLTDSTRLMINETNLAKMAPGSILVNTSRGAVIDEKAVLEALDSNHLGGAAFDVFAEEPSDNTALLAHDRFLGTPHIAGNAEEAVLAMGRAAIEGIVSTG